MFRKLQTIILVVLSVTLAGCQLARQSLIDVSVEEVKNAETCREVARNLLSHWLVCSGMIEGAIDLDKFPVEVFDAKNELDKLAEKYAEGAYTDYELGYALGLRVRILNAVVMQALEQYAPEVLDLLPLVL